MKKILNLVLTGISCFLISCNSKKELKSIIASAEKSIDTAAGSSPYLTKDEKGNVVLSWVKEVDSSSFIFCYAVSGDGGKTFEKGIEIPGSTNVHPHGENMPKIIFKPSGEIIAAWGAANPNPGNPYSGLVFYSQSFDKGRSWSERTPLTRDTASFDQRYFDLALLPDGEAAIVWLDNRKEWEKEGSGLYYAVTNGNKGFQNERLISGPCCQCCRTDLFIDKEKNIHVLYRAIINDNIRDMVHIISGDGKSFSQPRRINEDNWVIKGCPHTGPAIAETGKGVHFTWFTGGPGSGIYYNRSEDNGKTFTPRDSVSGKSARHCQITAVSNDHVLIVWNESFPRSGKAASRIGVELRNEEGNPEIASYITSEDANSSYPVLSAVDKDKVVVAYTETIQDKEMVFYKQVTIH